VADKRNIDVVIRGRDQGATTTVKKFNEGVKQATASATLLKAAAAGAGIAIARRLVDAMKEGIRLSHEMGETVAELTAALRATGDASPEVVNAFTANAKAIERMTAANEQAVLKGQALILSMGATREQANKAAIAAVDLSAATGIELQTAFRGLGQTLQGSSGLLGRFIGELREADEGALKSGRAIDIVAEKFQGRAAEQRDMFVSLGQAIEDLNRELGNFVDSTPAFVGAIAALTAGIRGLNDNMSDGEEKADVFTFSMTRFFLGLQSLGETVNSETLTAMGKEGLAGVIAQVTENMNAATKATKDLQENLPSEGPDAISATVADLGVEDVRDARDQFDALVESRDKLRAAFAEAGEPITLFIDQLRIVDEKAREIAERFGFELPEALKVLEETVNVTQTPMQKMKSFMDDFAESTTAAFRSSIQGFISGSQSASEAVKGLARTIVSSLASEALVEALMELARGFAALAKNDVKGAVLHFKSAGLFAAVGGVAAVAGRALNAQEGGLVPGLGFGDRVPALLEPGEFVLTRQQTRDLLGAGVQPSSRAEVTNIIQGGPSDQVEALLQDINDAVRFRGFRLVASEVTG
jgi:hypothetical protein